MARRIETGTIDRNAQRQRPISAKMPPSAGPSRVPTPQMVALSAIMRGQSRSGKTMRNIEMDWAISRPAPKPCTKRPMSRTIIDGARPQMRLPMPKAAAAMR